MPFRQSLLEPEAALEAAREAFPPIFARFTFPVTLAETFVLGDRCRKCLHWFWPEDGKWHSLIPKQLANDPDAGDYTCICPVCRSGE